MFFCQTSPLVLFNAAGRVKVISAILSSGRVGNSFTRCCVRHLHSKNITKKRHLTVVHRFLSSAVPVDKKAKSKTGAGSMTTVAVCQFTAKNDKNENFNICKNLIEGATAAGAKVIFLPEACDYVANSPEETLRLAEPLDGDLITKYKELAKTFKVWLSIGGIHERVENVKKVKNSHLIINSDGLVVAVYRKLHLYDVEIPEKKIKLKESEYVIRGEELIKPVPSPVGEIGLGTCYDVRFPEMSLILRKLGAKILTFPSAFTFATGAAHWEVLLRCRAIETQCYVVAAAQTGFHNEQRQSWGHAMIVDPSGNVIAQCSEGANFAIANIDHELIDHVRKSMPLKDHRRTDIYPEMLPISKVYHVQEEARIPDDIVGGNVDSVKNIVDVKSDNMHQFGQVNIPETCVFYKTNLSMAFVNKRCVVPGHVLVAPFRPAPRLIDLSPNEVSDLFLTVQKVESVMERVHGAGSTTIAVQDGPDAGRTIKHLHVHVLPRKKGDFLQNDQIYYELQQHDKIDDKPWRCEQDMNSEAADLRKYFS